MDAERFDALVKVLGSGANRRRVLKGIGGGGLAGMFSLVGARRGLAQDELECAAKVGICHRTKSEKNPFQYIEVCVDAVPAHAAHGDLVACPNLQVIDPETCTCICPIETIECPPGEELDEEDCLCVVSVCPAGGNGCTPGGCGPRNSCICTTERGGSDNFCFLQNCGRRCTSSAECVDARGQQIGLCSANQGCCGGGDCILFENIARCATATGLSSASVEELPAVERK